MSELAFEYLLAALESARGTPAANPTHYLNLAGTIAPKKERYRPNESRGTLAEYYRSVDVRRWAEWEAENGLDVCTLPLILNALVKGGVTAGVKQTGTTKTYLWTFAPTMNADDLKALSLWWGDPNTQVFRSAYCMPDELTITADASGTDGVTLSLSGQGQFPAKVTNPTAPSMLQAPFLMPSAMELWIDTSSAIGTTAVEGRLVSAEVTIPSGITRKWLAAGPEGNLDFQAVGRGKRHAELKLVLELPDMTQYDLWTAETALKTRIRFNGPEIEEADEVSYYNFVEVDIYGPFDALDWGEHEGTNRTVELTILSEYDATAGYDWCVRVQNDRSTL